jgi:hypothetical protein
MRNKILSFYVRLSIYDVNSGNRRACELVIVWYLDLELPLQPVLITSNVVSLHHADGEVY